MRTVRVSDFRQDIAEIGNQVRYAGERVVVSSRGKPAFALVPYDDVEFLEALEDRMDVEMAKEALRRNDFVPLEEARKQLGL